MSINLQLPKLTDLEPRLTVVGVGGAGCNAVNNMIASGLTGVEFVVANTDAQALSASSAEHRIQLGVNLTEGLGAGARPEVGEAAAEEAVEEIRAQVSGSHMVFLAAGMGGGTGTGAAAVIARVAREQGILVVGVVTKPFQFEGSRRMRVAEAGIEELKGVVDTLIVIPNQNLFRIANEKTTFAEAFVLADHVLYSGVACIVDLILKEGLINLDFADVRSVMSGMGTAMMGTGEASGERRASLAAEEAISNPLLDDITLQGAKGLLLSITGGPDLTLYEVDEAASRVRQEVDPEATIIVGATFDNSLDEKIRVSIVASGMERLGEQSNAGSGFMGLGSSRPVPAGATSSPIDVQAAGAEGFSAVAEGGHAGPSDFGAVQPPPVPPLDPHRLQQRLSEAIQSVSQDAAESEVSISGGWNESGGRSYETEGDVPRRSDMPGGGNATGYVDQGTYYDGAVAGSSDRQWFNEQQAENERHGHDEEARRRWQGPGGVVIEEGLAPNVRPGSGEPAPHAQTGAPSYTQASVAAQFNPEQPPSDVRRPARRMPSVEDFPVVGQREYNARVGTQHGVPQTHDRGVPIQSSQQRVRKKGLFERLTGIKRKQSDSFSEGDRHVSEGRTGTNSAPSQRHDVSKNRGDGVARQGTNRDGQPAELPEFFSHRRKG